MQTVWLDSRSWGHSPPTHCFPQEDRWAAAETAVLTRTIVSSSSWARAGRPLPAPCSGARPGLILNMSGCDVPTSLKPLIGSFTLALFPRQEKDAEDPVESSEAQKLVEPLAGSDLTPTAKDPIAL